MTFITAGRSRGRGPRGSSTLVVRRGSVNPVVHPRFTWRCIQSIDDARNDAAHGKVAAINVDDVRDALLSSREC